MSATPMRRIDGIRMDLSLVRFQALLTRVTASPSAKTVPNASRMASCSENEALAVNAVHCSIAATIGRPGMWTMAGPTQVTQPRQGPASKKSQNTEAWFSHQN